MEICKNFSPSKITRYTVGSNLKASGIIGRDLECMTKNFYESNLHVIKSKYSNRTITSIELVICILCLNNNKICRHI